MVHFQLSNKIRRYHTRGSAVLLNIDIMHSKREARANAVSCTTQYGTVGPDLLITGHPQHSECNRKQRFPLIFNEIHCGTAATVAADLSGT